MPKQIVEVKEFDGLFLQANSFSDVPDGGLEQAENVVISNDKKIEKKRGSYEYYDPGGNTAIANFLYQDRLIGVETDSIGYFTDTGSSPNITGNRTTNSGVSVSVNAADKSKSAQASDNLYMTTENGVVKLESFDGRVLTAGVPPALDLRGQFITGNVISNGNEVNYRIVFGRRDDDDVLYLGAPSDIFNINNTTGSSKDVELEFSIPEEIDSTTENWFYQVYRSSQGSGTQPLNFKLTNEKTLTSSQLTRGKVIHVDSTTDSFLGAELYTNPNSREGESQANTRPPFCRDIALYKEHMIYADCESRHLRRIDIIDSSVISVGDTIEIRQDGNTYTFIAEDGHSNRTFDASSVSGTGTITVNTSSAHGFSTGYKVFISNISGTGNEGLYTITVTGATSFTYSDPGSTPTALKYEGREDGSGNYLFYLDLTSGVPIQERETAIGLVRAINRNSPPFYARYISTPTGVPGQVRVQEIGFTGSFEMRAVGSTAGEAFEPNLPSTFDGSVLSTNDALPNGFFSSKIQESEAVPTVNFFRVSSKSARLQRVIALRDSLIIIKEDGVYRMTGDSVTTFTITALDNTIFCLAPESVAVLNNQIIFLSNQGFVLVTESSVEIISRRIEDVITPILGNSALASETNATTYESSRLYLCSTLEPDTNTASTVYAYNIITNAWTTWTNTFDHGIVGPNDRLYLLESDNIIRRERKDQTRIDYTNQNYSVTINSVSADLLSANVTLPGGVIPEAGDVIVKNDVFTRVTSAEADGVTYNLTFDQETNLEAGDVETLYSKYVSKIKFTPLHGGMVGRMKRYSSFQMHMGSDDVSKIDITFSGSYFGGSDVINWSRSNVLSGGSTQGWGNQPWGFFAWGEEDGIKIIPGTRPATIVRVNVPQFQARNTYIQAVLEHVQAGERINLQAIDYGIRSYGERTTR